VTAPLSFSLDALAPGSCARVAGFGPLPADLADRLLELGFDEGAEVETLHRAPLGGDPISVRVDGAVVALRLGLARAILLTRSA
jgi:ferrous iron transport protein A